MSDLPPSPPPPPVGPPPGYVAYGAPQAYRGYTKPVRGLGRALVVLQAIAAAGAIGVLALELGLRDEAVRVADGDMSIGSFEDELGLFSGAAVLSALAAVAGVVVLIVWSYRIASNLVQRGADPTWKPGLTIVAWLLGGCSLYVLPFLMLREHWNLSDPDAPPDALRHRQPMNPWIVAWFVLSLGQIAAGLVSGLRGVGGFNVGRSSEDVAETLADQLAVTWIGGILSVAAALVLIVVIRQLTDRHARSTGEA